MAGEDGAAGSVKAGAKKGAAWAKKHLWTLIIGGAAVVVVIVLLLSRRASAAAPTGVVYGAGTASGSGGSAPGGNANTVPALSVPALSVLPQNAPPPSVPEVPPMLPPTLQGQHALLQQEMLRAYREWQYGAAQQLKHLEATATATPTAAQSSASHAAAAVAALPAEVVTAARHAANGQPAALVSGLQPVVPNQYTQNLNLNKGQTFASGVINGQQAIYVHGTTPGSGFWAPFGSSVYEAVVHGTGAL